MQDAQHGVVPFIAIDRASPQPLYLQIYEGYREAIIDGRLRAGERLPSTRDLAEELGVSRFPVLNAFEQLIAEGYCEAQVGAGTCRALPPGWRGPGRSLSVAPQSTSSRSAPGRPCSPAVLAACGRSSCTTVRGRACSPSGRRSPPT